MSKLKLIILDLDGLTYYPEMYHLWGSHHGGKFIRQGDYILDDSKTKVKILGDLRQILIDLKSLDEYKDVKLGIASSCDEPEWAMDALNTFVIDDEENTKLIDYFEEDLIEIYKASSKQVHIKSIAKKSKVNPDEMIFFDNEMGNCRRVAELNTSVVYCSGIKYEMFLKAIESFPFGGKQNIITKL